uniref:Uncharacterized protein n=1 Tax=Tetraodon nigroviridis TaxID=99883 RepID=H3BXH5_TETNG
MWRLGAVCVPQQAKRDSSPRPPRSPRINSDSRFGYVHTWSQTAQNGHPAHTVEQSRPQPWSNWQVAKVPSTRPSQKVAGSSSQASHQAEAPTRRQRPSSPLKTATLFIDGVYVQMQTSARGRGRKVMAGSSSMPARFTSPQGRWLQGRYRPVPEDSQPPPGHRSGKTKSRFFNNAALAPGTRGTGRHQNLPGKRPSGSPDVHYAPTQVHEIPEHLGGFAIRRLKPQRWRRKGRLPECTSALVQGAA